CARSQRSHGPSHAVSQHLPSTQNPLSQSLGAEQLAPSGNSPVDDEPESLSPVVDAPSGDPASKSSGRGHVAVAVQSIASDLHPARSPTTAPRNRSHEAIIGLMASHLLRIFSAFLGPTPHYVAPLEQSSFHRKLADGQPDIRRGARACRRRVSGRQG